MQSQQGGDGGSCNNTGRPPTIKGRVPFLIPTSHLRTTCLTDMSSLPGSVVTGAEQQKSASTTTATSSRTTATTTTSKTRRRDGKIVRKRGTGGAFVALNNPKPKEAMRLHDEDPDRIRNPLIDVPPIVVGERAEAVELYTLTNLVFGREDTFPLSYYARLLGFDVPPPSKPHEPLDISSLPLVKEDVQHWKTVPPLGSFADEWWRSLSYRQEDGGGDGLLDYQDPVYRQIVSRKRRPFQVEDLKQVRLPYNPTQRKLHPQCLAMANKTILSDDNAKFSVLDGSGGDFGVLNETTGEAISYRLHWYHMEKEGAEPIKTSLGLHSATAYLKQTEKELVFFIHQFRVNVPKPKPKDPPASVFKAARATVRRKSSSMGGDEDDDEDEDSDYDGFNSSLSDSDRKMEAATDRGDTPVVEVVEDADPEQEVTATVVAEPVEEPAIGGDEKILRLQEVSGVKTESSPGDGTKREALSPSEGTKQDTSDTGLPPTKEEKESSPEAAKEDANDKSSTATEEEKKEAATEESDRPAKEGSSSAGLTAPPETGTKDGTSTVTSAAPATAAMKDGTSTAPVAAAGKTGSPSSASTVPATAAANKGTSTILSVHPAAKTAAVKKPREATDGEISDATLVTLTALALEHARACDIYYGFVQVPKGVAALLERTFRMRRLPSPGHDPPNVVLVVDLTKCSYKYAFMTLNNPDIPPPRSPPPPPMRHRMLVRLPKAYEVKSGATALGTSTATRTSTLTADGRPTVAVVGNAAPASRSVAFGIRVDTGDDTMKPLDAQGVVTDNQELHLREDLSPMWDVLRTFPLKVAAETEEKTDPEPAEDEILTRLFEAQKELASTESGLEPKLRTLLNGALEMRTKFEIDAAKRTKEREICKDYRLAQERRKEMDAIWQQQRDQDMDAVCDICNDGEVTPDNQILFCEACNVAVHQMCYGIDEVPEGDYYCVACRYFEREKMSATNVVLGGGRTAPKIAPTPLPICCELCPRKQGAFIRSENKTTTGRAQSKASSKWVHVLCAKWQGLNFVDEQRREVIEDVTQLKLHYRYTNTTCMICLGNRGAFHKCRASGCSNHVHVTCARMSGLCEVIHGEDCYGPVGDNPWSLLCPDHSTIDPDVEPTGNTGKMTVEQLQLAASEFPPEPYVPPPAPTKPFNKLNGKERRTVLSNPAYEAELLEELVTKKIQGVRCEVCDVVEADGKFLTRCSGCNVTFCDSCTTPFDGVGEENRNYKCAACRYKAEQEKTNEPYKPPQCSLCPQKGGWLREAHATPINKKSYWRSRPKEYQKTFFSKPFWVHQLCQMWQEKIALDPETAKADCDQVVMTHGMGFILEQNRCGLCGIKKGMKARCEVEDCRAWCEKSKGWTFHVTCARQSGLEVESRLDSQGWYRFYMRCFQHGGNSHNLRARLEDLIEIEKKRAGKMLEHADSRTMTFAHCARLLNSAILVMQILGWSWRWAEWWVQYNHTWEPLLEPGQKEEQMTKKELRIVESTQMSRCEDARRCRLAAFGAALRNRDFDNVENGDTTMLDRALRAILHTQSLVGPLEKWEIDFFAQWLGFAYRSKSRLLGFGDFKIPVKGEWKLMHEADKSPKFELGSRRLPGIQELPEGQIFETGFTEVDDFLLPERKADGTLFVAPEKKQASKKRGKKKAAALPPPPPPPPRPPPPPTTPIRLEKCAAVPAAQATTTRSKLLKKAKVAAEEKQPTKQPKSPSSASQDTARPDLPPPVYTPTGKKIGRPRLSKPRGPDRPKQRYTRKQKKELPRKSTRGLVESTSVKDDDDVYQSDSAARPPSKRARISISGAMSTGKVAAALSRSRRSTAPKSYKEPSDDDDVEAVEPVEASDAISARPTRKAAPTNLVEAELEIVAEEDAKPQAKKRTSRSNKEEENIPNEGVSEQSVVDASKETEKSKSDLKKDAIGPPESPRRRRRVSKEVISKGFGRTKRKRKAAPKNLAEPDETLMMAEESSETGITLDAPTVTDSFKPKGTKSRRESGGGKTAVVAELTNELRTGKAKVKDSPEHPKESFGSKGAEDMNVGEPHRSARATDDTEGAGREGSVLAGGPRRSRRTPKETVPRVLGRTKRKRKAAPTNLAEPDGALLTVEDEAAIALSHQPEATGSVEHKSAPPNPQIGERETEAAAEATSRRPIVDAATDEDAKRNPKSADSGITEDGNRTIVGIAGTVHSHSTNAKDTVAIGDSGANEDAKSNATEGVTALSRLAATHEENDEPVPAVAEAEGHTESSGNLSKAEAPLEASKDEGETEKSAPGAQETATDLTAGGSSASAKGLRAERGADGAERSSTIRKSRAAFRKRSDQSAKLPPQRKKKGPSEKKKLLNKLPTTTETATSAQLPLAITGETSEASKNVGTQEPAKATDIITMDKQTDKKTPIDIASKKQQQEVQKPPGPSKSNGQDEGATDDGTNFATDRKKSETIQETSVVEKGGGTLSGKPATATSMVSGAGLARLSSGVAESAERFWSAMPSTSGERKTDSDAAEDLSGTILKEAEMSEGSKANDEDPSPDSCQGTHVKVKDGYPSPEAEALASTEKDEKLQGAETSKTTKPLGRVRVSANASNERLVRGKGEASRKVTAQVPARDGDPSTLKHVKMREGTKAKDGDPFPKVKAMATREKDDELPGIDASPRSRRSVRVGGISASRSTEKVKRARASTVELPQDAGETGRKGTAEVVPPKGDSKPFEEPSYARVSEEKSLQGEGEASRKETAGGDSLTPTDAEMRGPTETKVDVMSLKVDGKASKKKDDQLQEIEASPGNSTSARPAAMSRTTSTEEVSKGALATGKERLEAGGKTGRKRKSDAEGNSSGTAPQHARLESSEGKDDDRSQKTHLNLSPKKDEDLQRVEDSLPTGTPGLSTHPDGKLATKSTDEVSKTALVSGKEVPLGEPEAGPNVTREVEAAERDSPGTARIGAVKMDFHASLKSEKKKSEKDHESQQASPTWGPSRSPLSRSTLVPVSAKQLRKSALASKVLEAGQGGGTRERGGQRVANEATAHPSPEAALNERAEEGDDLQQASLASGTSRRSPRTRRKKFSPVSAKVLRKTALASEVVVGAASSELATKGNASGATLNESNESQSSPKADLNEKLEKDSESKQGSLASTSTRRSTRSRSKSEPASVQHLRKGALAAELTVEAGERETKGDPVAKGDSTVKEGNEGDEDPSPKPVPRDKDDKAQDAPTTNSKSQRDSRSRIRLATKPTEGGTNETSGEAKRNSSETDQKEAMMMQGTVALSGSKSEKDKVLPPASPPSSPSRRSPRSRSRSSATKSDVKAQNRGAPSSEGMVVAGEPPKTVSVKRTGAGNLKFDSEEAESPSSARKGRLTNQKSGDTLVGEAESKVEATPPRHALLEGTPPKREAKSSDNKRKQAAGRGEEERDNASTRSSPPRPHKLKHALLGTIEPTTDIANAPLKVASQKAEAPTRPSTRVKAEERTGELKRRAPATSVTKDGASSKRASDLKPSTSNRANEKKSTTDGRTQAEGGAGKFSLKEPPKLKNAAVANKDERKKHPRGTEESSTARKPDEKRLPVARSKRPKRKHSSGASKPSGASKAAVAAAAKKPRSEEMGIKTALSSREARAARRQSRGRSDEAASKRPLSSGSRAEGEGISTRRTSRHSRGSARHNAAEQEAAFALLGFQSQHSLLGKRKYSRDDIYEDENDEVPLSRFGPSSQPSPFEDAHLPEEPEEVLFMQLSPRKRGRLRGKEEVVRQMFYTGRLR